MSPTCRTPPAYVNPPNGYGVQLDASHSVGIQPTTTFSWTVTDSLGHTTPLGGEDPRIDLPQGPYTVQLTATGLLGSIGPQYATADVQVKDVLIVAIGDSYASGEGNPVVPDAFDPQWAYSPDPAMNAENADAHRSTIAGPAQFALQLQEANPQEAVTFVSVADSGASIPAGVLGPMPSIGDPSVKLPAQISELESIIGTRHIDVLTVSVGADDIGFSTLAEHLIENTDFGDPSRASILSQFQKQPAGIAGALRRARHGDPGAGPRPGAGDGIPRYHPQSARPGRPDPRAGRHHIDQQERRAFASAKIIPALDAAVAAAAKRYNWTLVKGINEDFRTHGYPSTVPWIRTLGQSLEMQGDADGTFHPNAAGQQDIAEHLLAAYLGGLDRANGNP